jgi:hypothetical protein
VLFVVGSSAGAGRSWPGSSTWSPGSAESGERGRPSPGWRPGWEAATAAHHRTRPGPRTHGIERRASYRWLQVVVAKDGDDLPGHAHQLLSKPEDQLVLDRFTLDRFLLGRLLPGIIGGTRPSFRRSSRSSSPALLLALLRRVVLVRRHVAPHLVRHRWERALPVGMYSMSCPASTGTVLQHLAMELDRDEDMPGISPSFRRTRGRTVNQYCPSMGHRTMACRPRSGSSLVALPGSGREHAGTGRRSLQPLIGNGRWATLTGVRLDGPTSTDSSDQMHLPERRIWPWRSRSKAFLPTSVF